MLGVGQLGMLLHKAANPWLGHRESRGLHYHTTNSRQRQSEGIGEGTPLKRSSQATPPEPNPHLHRLGQYRIQSEFV